MHAQRQGLVIPDDVALPVDKEHPVAGGGGGKWIHQQHYASVPGRRTSDGAETDRSHASSSSSSQWAAATAYAHPRYGHGHGAAAASSSSSASSPAPRSLSLVSDHAAVASASALRARSPSMASSRGRARRSGGRAGHEEVDELASEEEEDDARLIAQRRRQLPSIRDHPDLFLRRSPESFLERNNGDANEDDRSVKLSPIMGYNAEPATKRSQQQQPRAAPKRKMTTMRDAGLDAAGSKRVRRAAEATTRTQARGSSVAQERKHSQDSTASSVAESYASARSMTGSACSGEESRQSHAGSTTTTTRRPTGLDMLLNAVSCSERGITSLSS